MGGVSHGKKITMRLEYLTNNEITLMKGKTGSMQKNMKGYKIPG